MSPLYYKAIRFQVCGAVCASDHSKNTHLSGSQLSQKSLPASNSVLGHLNIKVYMEVILSTEVEGLVYVCILSSVPFMTLDGMSHSMFIPEESDHSMWINGFLLSNLLIFMMTGLHSQRSWYPETHWSTVLSWPQANLFRFFINYFVLGLNLEESTGDFWVPHYQSQSPICALHNLPFILGLSKQNTVLNSVHSL